ncbi:polygalacturonase [Tripterygium wilfordii]|uniref:Polygalacturonase n=1 Tax=Tripterygium wilfordii TaxID=458696 RepID=A0A7J7DJU8_TRIWF|nr:polygalacturonase [Tripterygium wilfordii]
MKPFILLAVAVLVVFTTFSVVSVEARKHHNKNKSKPHHDNHQKKRSGNGNNNNNNNNNNAPPDHDSFVNPSPAPTQSTVFNVLSFGAKGDGVSDDSQAVVAAWKAACNVSGATLQIPAKLKFLMNPITLQGPCMPQLLFQVDGTILGPPRVGSWPKTSLFQWLNFKWVHDFTIQGSGIVDGQGFDWWTTTPSQVYSIDDQALRFYGSSNVTVRDITIINSPQCHLKFDSSSGVKVENVTISSPDNSPNTDGIHLQNTRDVEIHHSNIGCGDDCVSIQTGCSNIHIHHINCGPGHGISLGGLGKDNTVACVSDILVEEVSLQNTLAGVRIKTWQGGHGSVKNVTFANIEVSEVKVPIIIDQYYCDKKLCKNQTGAVAVSGVKYDQIIGTYSVQPIHLACSSEVPCTDVDLMNIQLKPASLGLGQSRGFPQQALCWNSYGKSQAPLVPSSIDYCLRRDGHGGSVSRVIEKSHERMICL